MNLGAFIGGAVQGYQQQEDRQIRQQEAKDNRALRTQEMGLRTQEMGFRERQMKMQEAEDFERQEKRNRDKAMREESAVLFKQHYPGDREEQVGETEADDGQGGVTKIPTMKRVPGLKPGTDLATDAKWYTDHLKLTAKYGTMSMEDMAKTAAKVDELRKTENGRLLDKVVTGDKAALVQLLKATGRDPTGATHVFKPLEGMNHIQMADGTTLDLKAYAAANATAAHYQQLKDAETSAQGTANSAATRKNLGSTSALHDAQAGLVPSQIKENEAQAVQARAAAGASGASANLANAKAKNVGADTKAKAEEKVDAQRLKEIQAVVEKDPSSVDGKGKNVDMAGFMVGRASQLARENPKMKGPEAVAQARQEWVGQAQRVSDFVDSEIKKLGGDKKKVKAHFAVESANPVEIKAAFMRRKMSAPAAPTGRAVSATTNAILSERD